MPSLQHIRNINQIINDLKIHHSFDSIQTCQGFCDALGRRLVPDVRLQVWDVKINSIDPVILSGWVSNQFLKEGLQYAFNQFDIASDLSEITCIETDQMPEFGMVLKQMCKLWETPERANLLDTLFLGETVQFFQKQSEMSLVRSEIGFMGWLESGTFALTHKNRIPHILSNQHIEYNTNYSLKNTIELIHETALSYLGVPYLMGGMTSLGIDCSGLVYQLYRRIGVQLPRDADQQFACGRICAIPGYFENLRCGDLLFFSGRYGCITHVAMAVDSQRFVHAQVGTGVFLSNIEDKNTMQRFLLAKRILT